MRIVRLTDTEALCRKDSLGGLQIVPSHVNGIHTYNDASHQEKRVVSVLKAFQWESTCSEGCPPKGTVF